MKIEPGREGDFHDIYVCEVDEFPDQEFSVFALALEGDDTYEWAIVCPFDADSGEELPLFFFRTSSMERAPERVEYEALAQQAMAAYVNYVKKWTFHVECPCSPDGTHEVAQIHIDGSVCCKHCDACGSVPFDLEATEWDHE